jgi:putative FmdB family regulatory protein
MPLYEYVCKKCGHRFEKIRKFSDKQLRKCPECGGVIEQTITAPSVQFKGSGFYQTDYKKTGSSSSSTSEADASSAEKKDSKESKESKDSKEAKTIKTDDKPKSESSPKKQKKD